MYTDEDLAVARAGWNDKGMWLALTVRSLPWIGMKTADDCFVPWVASQTDLLAEDRSEAD
jgi:hypothetical protein